MKLYAFVTQANKCVKSQTKPYRQPAIAQYNAKLLSHLLAATRNISDSCAIRSINIFNTVSAKNK